MRHASDQPDSQQGTEMNRFSELLKIKKAETYCNRNFMPISNLFRPKGYRFDIMPNFAAKDGNVQKNGKRDQVQLSINREVLDCLSPSLANMWLITSVFTRFIVVVI